MATTTKTTLDGTDLVGTDSLKVLNISKPLTFYSVFDTNILTAIDAFKGEPLTPAVAADKATGTLAVAAVPGSWIAKVKGLDIYDSNLTTLQTINLISGDSSSLLIKTQNTDAANNSSSYDFTSPNSVIHVLTNATISNAAPVVVVNPKAKPVKVNPNIKLAYEDKTNSIIYTNSGVTGTQDDIRADLTQISKAIFTTKNNIFSANVNYKESLSYYEGEKYKVEISTTKAVLSNSPALSFSPTKNSVVISKYAYLSNDFSILLTGNITGTWGADGNTEIMTLKNITVQTADYSLQTANLIYKNIYTNAEYVAKSGLTNLDTYNLTPVGDMQTSLISRDLPKILSGNNIITLKGAGSVDAGAGNDIIIGSASPNTLVGGAGSDKLTGGKIADTFSFQQSDFLTANKNGDLVFNKSVDTITDFNAKEGDLISFDGQTLTFPHDLAEAKTAKMPLFYLKGSVYFDVNLSEDIYAPTVIIKLTGNPKVNADSTDFLTA